MHIEMLDWRVERLYALGFSTMQACELAFAETVATTINRAGKTIHWVSLVPVYKIALLLQQGCDHQLIVDIYG